VNSSLSTNPDLLKAGRIAAETRKMIATTNLVGRTITEICDIVENNIRRLGAEPSFPCNVSINEVTAHCTAPYDDSEDIVITEGDLVTIDLGAHINGYLSDTATTVSSDPAYDLLIQATKDALDAALQIVKIGVPVGDLGRIISESAAQWGFRPITNLTGHSMERYQVHSGTSIPNTWTAGLPRLKANTLYAVEPFLTFSDGAGLVVDGGAPRIFGLVSRKVTGKKNIDKLVDEVWRTRKTLPFTPRWYSQLFDKNEITSVINELVKRSIIRGYPILVERTSRPVAQFEHTFIPTETSALVTTG
jgi:methionyl aminopeptidase